MNERGQNPGGGIGKIRYFLGRMPGKYSLKPDDPEPTAASEELPAKRPTTMTSAALKRNCRQLDSIKGKLNAMTFGKTGPLHISILYESLDIIVPSIFGDIPGR